MLIYEVNLTINAEIIDAFHDWLMQHIHEMVALPGFSRAEWLEVSEPKPASDQRTWCIQYYLNDQMALDHYLQEYAPKMRSDGIERFGNAFTASRRVLFSKHKIDSVI